MATAMTSLSHQLQLDSSPLLRELVLLMSKRRLLYLWVFSTRYESVHENVHSVGSVSLGRQLVVGRIR